MSKKEDALAEFVLALRANFPDKSDVAIIGFAKEMMRRARRLHTLAEECCNTGSEDADRRHEKASQRAIDLATGFGFDEKAVRINGDPRGFAVYLKMPNGQGNSWTSGQWGI